ITPMSPSSLPGIPRSSRTSLPSHRASPTTTAASSGSSSTRARRRDRPSSTSTPTFSSATSERIHVPNPTDPETSSQSTPEPATAEAKLHVDGIAMVRLLGAQDRLLSTIETRYPEVSLHVRGNDITLTGDPRQVSAARALIAELIDMVKQGQ